MAIIYDERGNAIRYGTGIGGETISDGRQLTQNISALNGEVFMDIQNEHHVIVGINGTFSATSIMQYTVDGNTYYSSPIWDVQAEKFIVGITAAGVYQIDMPSGARRARLLCSAYTSGAITVAMRGNMAQDFVYAKPIPTTTTATTTAATGAAATLTIASAGAGLFHYITRLVIERHTSAALTAAATPIIITTTNINGSLAFSIPADAATQGSVYREVIEIGEHALKTTTAGTATTIVAPAVTGVIWRITAYYYIGA